MQFDSPRFAGDAVLEDILNDPDTGTKKLQKHSPADAVRKVQQALFDMNWPLRMLPPITDESVFVDGDYGPATEATVLAYKQHYDIHFPPDAPTGSYDGLTGPRTLRKLDPQCVGFDAAAAAIEQKAADLQAAGLTVELNQIRPTTAPVLNSSGSLRTAVIEVTDGAIFHERGIGAFEVHGAIFDEYKRQNGPSGSLGFPVSDEQDDGEGFRRSDFQHGVLRWNLDTDVVELIPA